MIDQPREEDFIAWTAFPDAGLPGDRSCVPAGEPDEDGDWSNAHGDCGWPGDWAGPIQIRVYGDVTKEQVARNVPKLLKEMLEDWPAARLRGVMPNCDIDGYEP